MRFKNRLVIVSVCSLFIFAISYQMAFGQCVKGDVNGDGKTGLEEAVYALQIVAELRTAETPPTIFVNISNFQFGLPPHVISVSAGAMITWTNNDAATHTVTVDSATPAGGPSSGDFSQEQSYSWTVPYAELGTTWSYHCIHHSMTGSITVKQTWRM